MNASWLFRVVCEVTVYCMNGERMWLLYRYYSHIVPMRCVGQHMDFLWATDAKTRVYDPVLSLLRSVNGESGRGLARTTAHADPKQSAERNDDEKERNDDEKQSTALRLVKRIWGPLWSTR